MWKKRIKWFVGILIVLSAALFAFARYQFHYVPERAFETTLKAEPYDAIIVPGIPYTDGQWGWLMKTRVYWAKYLFDQGVTRNIIFSGSAVHSPYVEAEIMVLYALELGIPSANIFKESEALHSTENVDYSCIVASNQCFKRLAVATDPFQSLLLEQYIAKKNLSVDCIPAVLSITSAMDTNALTIDPTGAFVTEHIPLDDQE